MDRSDSKRAGSTGLTAAKRLRSGRMGQRPLDLAMRKSSMILLRAVSAECTGRNPN